MEHVFPHLRDTIQKRHTFTKELEGCVGGVERDLKLTGAILEILDLLDEHCCADCKRALAKATRKT